MRSSVCISSVALAVMLAAGCASDDYSPHAQNAPQASQKTAHFGAFTGQLDGSGSGGQVLHDLVVTEAEWMAWDGDFPSCKMNVLNVSLDAIDSTLDLRLVLSFDPTVDEQPTSYPLRVRPCSDAPYPATASLRWTDASGEELVARAMEGKFSLQSSVSADGIVAFDAQLTDVVFAAFPDDAQPMPFERDTVFAVEFSGQARVEHWPQPLPPNTEVIPAQ